MCLNLLKNGYHLRIRQLPPLFFKEWYDLTECSSSSPCCWRAFTPLEGLCLFHSSGLVWPPAHVYIYVCQYGWGAESGWNKFLGSSGSKSWVNEIVGELFITGDNYCFYVILPKASLSQEKGGCETQEAARFERFCAVFSIIITILCCLNC